MNADKQTAVVIRLGNGRFFSGFGKKNRVLSAHCLAGAKLFQITDDHNLSPTLMKLNSAGKFWVTIKIAAFDTWINNAILATGFDTDINSDDLGKEMQISLPPTMINALWFDNKLTFKGEIDKDLPF